MKLTQLKENARVLSYKKEEILFSYETAIGWRNTETEDTIVRETLSQTSKTHISIWLKTKHNVQKVDDDKFEKLLRACTMSPKTKAPKTIKPATASEESEL